MGGGYRYVVGGIIVIALVFAALSLVPTMVSKGWLSRKQSQTVQQANPPAGQAAQPGQAVTPVATTPDVEPPPPPPDTPPPPYTTAPQQTQNRPVRVSSNKKPRSRTQANNAHYKSSLEEMREDAGWLYTQRAVLMRVEPDGEPFTPISASSAPLVVLAGTRVRHIDTDGEWVLVESCQSIGWMRKRDVGEEDVTRPAEKPLDPWGMVAEERMYPHAT